MMRGLGRAKRILNQVKRQFKPAAVILMYHRIADVPVDPRGTAVSPENFAQHLDYVYRTCHPLHLLELVEGLRTNSLPRRAVAITFDDGHVSVLQQAYPLLASAQIPATAFITTGHIDDPYGFWWDELDRVMLFPERVPDQLNLLVAGQEYSWVTGGWEERLKAYTAIRRLVRTLPHEERRSLLSHLSRWAGVEKTTSADCRPMTAAELRQLIQAGIVELGAHTITHPILADLPADAQIVEIMGSRSVLEAIIRRPVLTFAYPYGQTEHFTEETIRIVETAGFHAACTTRQGVVEHRSCRFQLNRCEVANWGIAAFKKHLEWLFVS